MYAAAATLPFPHCKIIKLIPILQYNSWKAHFLISFLEDYLGQVFATFSITWPDIKSQNCYDHIHRKQSFNFLKPHHTTESTGMDDAFLMDMKFSCYIAWCKTTYRPFIPVTVDLYRHLFGVVEVPGIFCGDHLYIHLQASNSNKMQN